MRDKPYSDSYSRGFKKPLNYFLLQYFLRKLLLFRDFTISSLAILQFLNPKRITHLAEYPNSYFVRIFRRSTNVFSFIINRRNQRITNKICEISEGLQTACASPGMSIQSIQFFLRFYSSL